MFDSESDDTRYDLREWAQGSTAMEAAVELLLRGFNGVFADSRWPWIEWDDERSSYMLNSSAIPEGIGALSGGERRYLLVVASLLGEPFVLGELAGLDREHTALVLCAIAHSGSLNVDRDEPEASDEGWVLRPVPALAPWPEVA